MTLTRTQAGKTPKKTEFPDFVETPGRRRSSRKSEILSSRADDSDAQASTGTEDNDTRSAKKTPRRKSGRIAEAKENGSANGHANGHLNGHVKDDDKTPVLLDGWMKGNDTKTDHSGHFEFGGSPGVSAVMIGFPLLMYYMWIGATYYDGKFPRPEQGQTYQEFARHLYDLAYTGAYPHRKAWIMYWGMFVFEVILYCFAPGIWAKGKPLPHENGRQLPYYCSASWAWWITIPTALVLHFTGIFKLYTIIDEFGPLMTVAIISGFACSLIAYVSAIVRGAQHRMTGYPIYDFFMGAELNPRMFGILDFKMFFEVRLPWYILFLLTLGACARQYEQYGYVSGELGLLLMAHFLYGNACAKAEQLIVSTWDMYYEKFGFMLCFWNMAGVPLSYCHCTVYLANHDPKTYSWNKYALGVLYVAYLFVYWVWDTTNSQKNSFRAQERGVYVDRKTFPQLPWKVVKNPRVIRGENGVTILADGMYGYARKLHYTCDLFFALSWGAVTGLNSPFPWFYPVFFTCMIIHRALRDIQRCRERYGKAWEQYEKEVPYLFIPYVF